MSAAVPVTRADIERMRVVVLEMARLLEHGDTGQIYRRFADWEPSGLPGGSDATRRGPGHSDPVPAMAQVMAGYLDAKTGNLVRSFTGVGQALCSELVAAMRPSKPTTDERMSTSVPLTFKVGKGRCDICGREMPGGELWSQRLKDGLCPTHYKGLQRARERGETRDGYVGSMRAMLGLPAGDTGDA